VIIEVHSRNNENHSKVSLIAIWIGGKKAYKCDKEQKKKAPLAVIQNGKEEFYLFVLIANAVCI
jgi:hypothetical protein